MSRSRNWIRMASFAGIALAAFAVGSLANQKADDASNFGSQTIDLGVAVSDIDKSLKFYKDVLGFTEVPGFKVSGEYGAEVGLSDKHELDVHVLVLGNDKSSTKLKLMQFKNAPGTKIDNTYVHSSVGFRYLTIHVKNLNLAVDQGNKSGGKLVAKSPLPLPPGFPADMGLAIYRDPDGNLVELVGPWKK